MAKYFKLEISCMKHFLGDESSHHSLPLRGAAERPH
jgi:hypothetical protein